MIFILSLIPLAAWAYLVFGRGGFWLCRERDDAVVTSDAATEQTIWPHIVAIIPARDEEEFIAQSVGSLLRQDYPGRLSVILVDDQSTDDTSKIALATAHEVGGEERLRIVAGRDAPPGWTGKLWAMRQGLEVVDREVDAPLVLFADADIAFKPHVLSRLVAISLTRKSLLTSLMVLLRCESAAERWLTPAFIFFFQMLYPFPWSNDPKRKTAAAAGGCMLVQRDALAAAGGLEALRGALIDDCSLAAIMKQQGTIWLGLTESAFSLRPYPSFAEFGRMVSRSAYAELRYSPLRLAGAVVGMSLVYLAPPLLTIFARGYAEAFGALAWALMALCLAPTMRLYRRPVLEGLALPAVAAAYVAFTLKSALQYWRGQGGAWKGRVNAPTGKTGVA
jgi:hopene-associated glycosyltransferase HpnB